jgi:hypothetical protein
MKPKRIQVRRVKGWRMPANTVYVGRPTKWGNPFPVAVYGREEAVRRFEAQYRESLMREPIITRQMLDRDLRGKNLACWCPLDQPCHADVLLRLANPEGSGTTDYTDDAERAKSEGDQQ